MICCHARTIETDDYFLPVGTQRTKFETFLENLKPIIRNGSDELGLPPLDPFNLKRLPIKINENTVKLDALLTDLYSRGLSEYTVIKGDFVLIGLKIVMSLSWPLVHAKTNYAMKGQVSEFPIYGNGDMKADVKEFSISLEISFKMVGEHLQVKSIVSNMSLKALEFKATGLFDDEEVSDLLSALISDTVPEVINNNPELVKEQLHSIIKQALDSFLSSMTIADLIKLLG